MAADRSLDSSKVTARSSIKRERNRFAIECNREDDRQVRTLRKLEDDVAGAERDAEWAEQKVAQAMCAEAPLLP